MPFRINGANLAGGSVLVKTEVSASIAPIASAAYLARVIAVSGVTADECIDCVFASAHSALVILECQVLSANNVQVTFQNITNASYTLGGATFRFVSK